MVTELGAGNESTFLYRFLVSPQFRWARYLILFVVLGVISFNQIFIIYIDYRDILGGWLYVFSGIYLLTYLCVAFLNLFVLFPRYLLKRRYFAYLALLSAAMVFALIVQLLLEYGSCVYWPEINTRGTNLTLSTVMDYISSFFLSTLCMVGGTMTVLLKEWMTDHQRVSQLEKEHILSEVERLKEQISPELLFNTLHCSGELTLTEPDAASKILMKLSQLLRYQLYDCNRAKVLLSGEITFLTNYLTLEQSHLPNLKYTLTSDGEVNRILVPPLLFIPFVQYAVKRISEQRVGEPACLNIHLKAEKDMIVFTCICPEVNLSSDKELERIRKRLDLLYNDRYELLLTLEEIRLELKEGRIL